MLKNIKLHIKKFVTTHYIVVTLAIALQIQITLFANDDYLGLRISLADILIPFLGVFIVHSLITKKSTWPKFILPFTLIWLTAMAAVMSAALINGYIVNKEISSWALINKYSGFWLLISYFLLGGWIITNTKDMRYTLSLFTSIFTTFFVITITLSAAMVFLQYIAPFKLWLPNYPWDGFMANRNAFMILFIMSFIFIIWGYADKTIIKPPWIKELFFIATPIFFIFNDSRTGWIASAILVFILFAKEPIKRAKLVAPALLLGCLIAYSSYYVTKHNNVLYAKQAQHFLAMINNSKDDMDYFGDQKRYLAVEDGIELYQKYNPLVGAGLGSYKPFQIEKRGEFIDVMDFTALWLLVETGAVGISVFIAFFITCAWCLYKQGYAISSSPYHRAMLIFLIMFAAMSILHELMYIRILWFSIGLALAHSYSDSTKRML